MKKKGNTNLKTNVLKKIFISFIIFFFIITIIFFRIKSSNKVFIKGWKILDSMNLQRRALASVAVNGKLYAIGGMDSNNKYVKYVEYTSIKEDGTIGTWQVTTSLIEGRFYLSALELNGYIYAIGGAKGERGVGNRPIASVERAKIKSDGSLSQWEFDSYLTTPRRGLKTVVYNGNIYAIGGYNGTFLKSVEHGSVNEKDGHLNWQKEKESTIIDRYIHSTAIYKNFIYVLGGHVRGGESVSYRDVEMSAIRSDYSLTPWKVESTSLLTPRFIASAFTLSNYLYLLGGHSGNKRYLTVEYAPISTNGHVGKWSFAPDLNILRSGASVSTWKNMVYVLGGTGNNGSLDAVEVSQ